MTWPDGTCDVRTLHSPLVGQTPAPTLDFTIGGSPLAVPTYHQTYNYCYLIDGPPPPVSADRSSSAVAAGLLGAGLARRRRLPA